MNADVVPTLAKEWRASSKSARRGSRTRSATDCPTSSLSRRPESSRKGDRCRCRCDMCDGTNQGRSLLVQVVTGKLQTGRDTMNTTTMKLRAGDVIELEIDGDVVSALVLLANSENVIFDLCDGDMPYVARQEDLANVRIFDGLAA